MNLRARGRRYAKKQKDAVNACLQGESTIREASLKYGVAKPTLGDALKKARNPRLASKPSGRKPSFTTDEEELIKQTLQKYAAWGVPLNRRHLREAFSVFIASLPPQRRNSLPFKSGVPGLAFLRGFEKRYSTEIQFGRPTKQEAKRWNAVNATTLVTHFATFEKLLKDNAIDSQRLWNLDETGCSPGNDACGSTKTQRYLTRHTAEDFVVPNMETNGRITMLPVVSVDGDVGPPLFVFSGARMPYRNILVGGTVMTDTLANHLPFGSTMAMREKIGGVDSQNFLSWAKLFVEYVRPLTANGRTVVLTYDGCRAHMTLAVLELFAEAGIIVCALPSHTSEKTQPLDLVVFAAFKQALNEVLSDIVRAGTETTLSLFDFCSCIREAYKRSMTRDNIQSGFRRSGLWPLDPIVLLKSPRPLTSKQNAPIVSLDQMISMLDQKREENRRAILGDVVQILTSGYVDTTSGVVLTSDEALNAARKHNLEREKRKAASDLVAQRRQLAAARRDNNHRKLHARLAQAATATRAHLANMSVHRLKSQCRSINERRANARIRTLLKRNAQLSASNASIESNRAGGISDSEYIIQRDVASTVESVAFESRSLFFRSQSVCERPASQVRAVGCTFEILVSRVLPSFPCNALAGARSASESGISLSRSKLSPLYIPFDALRSLGAIGRAEKDGLAMVLRDCTSDGEQRT